MQNFKEAIFRGEKVLCVKHRNTSSLLSQKTIDLEELNQFKNGIDKLVAHL